MPQYRIRIVGSDFDADDAEEGVRHDYPNTEAAVQAAINAAIAIAADDCSRGQCGCVLEARIEDGSNLIARYAVALSVEPLPPLN